MALLPKKTYSKHSSEISLLCDREKENLDPFDELLSSPLKQEVQFQPLSFWDREVKDSEPKKKSEKTKYKLYESSDSDDLNSPCQRKRKHYSKNSVTKARTLQYKSVSHKLNVRRNNNYSTAHSFIKRRKFNKTVLLNGNRTLVPAEDFEKNKDWSLNSTSYPSESMEETLILPYKNCDNLKLFNERMQDANKADCSYSNGRLNTTLNSFRSEKYINKNVRGIYNNFINPKNTKLKINENISVTMKQIGKLVDGEVKHKDDLVKSTVNFDECIEETFGSPYKDPDFFKFINLKRCFNFPNCFNVTGENFYNLSKSVNSEETESSQHCSDLKSSFSLNHEYFKTCEDISLQSESARNIVNETSTYNEEDSVNSSLYCYKYMDKTFYIKNLATPEIEESKIISMLECLDENTFSSSFDFASFNNSELEDLILKLLEQQKSDISVSGVAKNSSSTSEDSLSEHKEEDTIIKVSPKRNKILITEKDIINFHSPSNEISQLTTGISDLSILDVADSALLKSETEKLGVLKRDKNYKDPEKESFSIDLRNVTTKRRGRLNKYEKNVSCADEALLSVQSDKAPQTNDSETEVELEQTFEQLTNRMTLDWNRSIFFSNPIFESTRVVDVDFTEGKVSQKEINQTESFLDETNLNYKFSLKPGKKWFRSRSVLKQLQSRSLFEERSESTKITGRNFKGFVHDVLEMQNADITAETFSGSSTKNSFSTCLSGYQTILECESLPEDESNRIIVDDTALLKSVSSTILERSLLNRTVKVTQPTVGPSAFRSALGLEINYSDIQDDSIQESSVSARDFILMECGQEDVLSFEEYFNERTLKNCKKIGEGVYGEVFMSSDSVIKIIPIEGSEKVNGEPQKTFEEIISEVVIASKLSNLRKAEKHRTDCFSELKRCWCVKGKYPKYLLKLWNDYDQLGTGSENDSPVMFKDDQLYIILELANGGKDLESFVFSSSAQSLSIFIQATFGLAAAEKAFEFEHRDLHWGNVLISETQNKFMTVVLDGIEYKVPTKGVKICIIDFTLSRINHESCCIFNDLSVDPGLFTSEGDYQFEIYRMMLAEVQNDWSLFRPKTNLFWLHYMLDKMIKMVRYKNKRAKVHAKHLKDMKILESVILEYKDSTDFLLSEFLGNIINKL